MTTLEQQMAYADNWRLILELWPAFAPTDAQKDLWARKLSEMHQCRLRAAIEETATELIGLHPKLSLILKAYKGRGPSRRSEMLPAPDPYIEQDMLDMIEDLKAEHPTTRLAMLRQAADAAAFVLSGRIGPDAKATHIGASAKIIEHYKDVEPDEWPRLLVGFAWSALKEELPF